MATLKDVSRLAKVSTASVSRVMNGDYSSVSEETRQRILEVAKQLSYQPNRIARGLVKKRTYIIGLLIPDVSNPYYADLVKGVEEKTEKNGYNLILCNTQDSMEKEKKYLNMLLEYNVDGVILTGMTSYHPDSAGLLEAHHTPYASIDRADPNASVALYSNSQRGTYYATEYLIRCGHRRIGFIGGELQAERLYGSKLRMEGYLSALEHYEIPHDALSVRNGGYTIESGYKCAKDLLNCKPDITAIVCTNDLIAFGVIKAAREKGLRVPEDLSVTGYDDIELCSFFEPKLTTIRQDSLAIGKYVCEELLGILAKEKQEGIVRSVDPELIIRNSVQVIPTSQN